jgi:hypothetical protein
VERRGPDRPHNGQTAVCPRCGLGTVEFNERYRLPGSNGRLISTAAWVCDAPQCGYHQAVRGKEVPLLSAQELRIAAAKLRAQARRDLMKARFVRQRASRTLSKSRSRRKKSE